MHGNDLILAVDLGASKTNLGLYEATQPQPTPIREASCRTRDYPEPCALLEYFIAEWAQPRISRACLGVPGPVFDNRCATTNLPWRINGGEISQKLGIPSVQLVNDLMATAAAIPALQAADLLTINRGKIAAGGSIAVVAPGTGLGEAFLTIDASGFPTPRPSEGGHCDFAPGSPLEIELLGWLRASDSHVSYEQVCSGIGITNLYNFLKSQKQLTEPEELREILARSADPSRGIIANALSRENACELSRQTLGLFVSILGAEAGNLALKTMATGGVYIGGGIIPRIAKIFDAGLFLKSFRDKGRLSEVMSAIPIHVIMNLKAPVLGAARLASPRSESAAQ